MFSFYNQSFEHEESSEPSMDAAAFDLNAIDQVDQRSHDVVSGYLHENERSLFGEQHGNPYYYYYDIPPLITRWTILGCYKEGTRTGHTKSSLHAVYADKDCIQLGPHTV